MERTAPASGCPPVTRGGGGSGADSTGGGGGGGADSTGGGGAGGVGSGSGGTSARGTSTGGTSTGGGGTSARGAATGGGTGAFGSSAAATGVGSGAWLRRTKLLAAEPAARGAASSAGIETSSLVSRRSIRCNRAASVSLADGSSSRAHTTSSKQSRRGSAPHLTEAGVHHLGVSGQRRGAEPLGLAAHPFQHVVGRVDHTARRGVGNGLQHDQSRNRSSRSMANRRGSWPASIKDSMAPNSAEASPAASASTEASISARSVAPSRASAR